MRFKAMANGFCWWRTNPGAEPPRSGRFRAPGSPGAVFAPGRGTGSAPGFPRREAPGEPVVCEFAVRALSENGYIVFSASNGEEAEDIFEKEQGDFDLVFSDVVLPDRDGLNLIDEFISRKPEVLVLLSSGYTDKKSQWDRINAKSFPFLQKPYALVDLLKIVKKVIRKRV
jgi:CheY-like chemotaxis protein